MTSSRNRFDVLRDAPSSSKEQETDVPITGTEEPEDQTMQGTAQPGSSTEGERWSTQGLKDCLPHVPSRAQSTAKPLRLGVLQQGTSSRHVRAPIPSISPLHGVRKRTASFDEGEGPSKRRRSGLPSPRQVGGELPVAAPATVSGSSIEESDLETNGSLPATALAVLESPAVSSRSSFRWTDIRNPRNPHLCILQANNSSLVGSFAEDTEGWSFELTFDAGRRRIPTMTMKFFSNGAQGPQLGQTGWCLGDYIEGDWMVTDFKVHHVADCLESREIGHHDVLAACKLEEDKARLACISLEAWPKVKGHFNIDECANPNPTVKELLSSVFTGGHPYQLRIWFLAPGELETFERQCLSFFTRYFEQRTVPHAHLYDADDVGFADYLRAQEEASSA